MAVPVTVIIPTLNEHAHLAAALDSVRWADEVIIVDGGSTDDTVAIGRAQGATVLVLTEQTIGAQRNLGIDAATHDWILALDADELATVELRDSIARLCAGDVPPFTAFRIRSRNWHLGRELRHGPWGRDWKIRVFSKEHRFTDDRVHERLDVDARDVGWLSGELIHHPYQDLSHHVQKIATYARWAARDMRDAGRRASFVDLLARPTVRFVRDYVLMSGWRDGVPGFIVAVASSFSVFCKYASLAVMPPRDRLVADVPMERIAESRATK